MTSVSGGAPGVPTRSASGLDSSGPHPAGQQACQGRDERQEEVLGQEGRRDQATSRIFGGAAIITFCCTVVSLIPSFKAARMRPVTAISHVG